MTYHLLNLLYLLCFHRKTQHLTNTKSNFLSYDLRKNPISLQHIKIKRDLVSFNPIHVSALH